MNTCANLQYCYLLLASSRAQSSLNLFLIIYSVLPYMYIIMQAWHVYMYIHVYPFCRKIGAILHEACTWKLCLIIFELLAILNSILSTGITVKESFGSSTGQTHTLRLYMLYKCATDESPYDSVIQCSNSWINISANMQPVEDVIFRGYTM